MCAQDLPDIMEVEVSPSGDWRLPGSEGRWHSIMEDPADALTSVGVQIKPDPEQAGGAAGAAHPVQRQNNGPHAMRTASLQSRRSDYVRAGGDSDSEELSEGEELRRAAAAATASTAARQSCA